jgi:twitching motility protein PilU
MKAMKFMYQLLQMMLQKKGSDLFITAGFPPAIKIDGKMTPVSNQVLTSAHSAELARAIMNDVRRQSSRRPRNATLPFQPAGIGRFRVNAFWSAGPVGVVLRTINMSIPDADELQAAAGAERRGDDQARPGASLSVAPAPVNPHRWRP